MKLFFYLSVFLSFQIQAQEITTIDTECPFTTALSKLDQNFFENLQNYFKTISNNPECSQTSKDGMQTISDLKSIMSTDEAKCYTLNIYQTKLRDSALANNEKGIEIDSSSPYNECSSGTISKIIGQPISKDKTSKCIADFFQNKLQECKSVKISQSVQDKISKGMGDLQNIVSSNISTSSKCGVKAQDSINMVMNTAKTISAFLPWGAVAGAGIDLVNTAVDKYFSGEVQEVSNMMDTLLGEETYESNACLYYGLQQKLYCADKGLTVVSADPLCVKNNSDNGIVKLLENVDEIKKATAEVVDSGVETDLEDTSYLESNIDDLIKYAKSSEQDIRNRIIVLPKVNQARELQKVNYFYKLLNVYQLSNRDTPAGVDVGEKALKEIMPLLYSTDPNVKINFDQLIFSTTPNLKMEIIKKRGIVFALKNSQVKNIEDSRRVAKLSKYKDSMNSFAQVEMKNYLVQSFDEFIKQITQLSKNKNSFENDLVSEGMLRNIVRHCVMMQEIYDPLFEGKIPDQCARMNCGIENRMHWFSPKDGQNNVDQFKKSYCEKVSTYKEIENQYVKELKNNSGAKMCGVNIINFLEIKL